MGCVYLAQDPRIDRKVALKVFSPQGVDREVEEEFQQRFVTEAKAAGRLNHPGIVTIYDAGTDEESGLSFIAMEWIEGISLEDLLRRRGRLTPAKAVEVVSQIAVALDYAHGEGVIHRDVKPANVLIGKDGRARVMDFGVAKLGKQNLTAAGVSLGTPAFMSPEQVRAQAVDARSDVFSLGTVLYMCLSGKSPFMADHIAGITFKIAHEEPTDLRSLVPEIPEAVVAVTEQALRKAPKERFQSCAEFARALAETGMADTGTLTLFPKISDPDGLDDLEDFKDLPDLDATVHATVRKPWKRYLGWAVVAAMVLGLGGLFARTRMTPPEAGNARETPSSEPASVSPAGEGEASASEEAPPPSEETSPPQAVGSTPAVQEPEPEPPAKSTLGFSYVNRFRRCQVTIRVDGKQVWTREMVGKGGLRKVFSSGEQHYVELPVDAGKHSIEVRVTSETGVNASTSLRGTLPEGRTRVLLATLRNKVLTLEWQD